MSKRILIQLDPDPHPSSFDSVVAIDSDVDHLLRYGDVQVTSVTPLVPRCHVYSGRRRFA